MTAPNGSKLWQKGVLNLAWHRKSLVLFFLILSVPLNAAINWNNNAGEDITTSRINFLSSDRNNFLGAFAGLFYGSIPEVLITWWQSLLLLQGLLTLAGLLLLFEHEIRNASIRRVSLICGLAYVFVFLGMAPTRDGAMISFAIFGIGLIQKPKAKQALVGIGIVAILISFSFRPWLSLAFAPIIYKLIAMKFKTKKSILLISCIPILLTPIFIENQVKNIWEFSPAYPQQTVMIHDVSSSYCLSTSQSTRDKAFLQLQLISKNEESLLRICEFYKPSTWQAVIVRNLTDSRISHLEPPISKIQPERQQEFETLQANWINLIVDDPGTYIQNHLYFLTQILISGESSKLYFQTRVAEFNSSHRPAELFWVFISLFQLPVQILIRLHLLSPLITILGLIIINRRYRDSTYLSSISSYSIALTAWILITTLGFVSDNGRYTYLPIILLWAVFLKYSGNNQNEKG